MRNRLISLSLLTFISMIAAAQVRVVQPVKKSPATTTNLSIGFGVIRSVVYLTRNVKENNDATGLNLSLVYGGHRLLRGSIEFSKYRMLDIEPTWYDVKATSLEGNVHFLARFPGEAAYFYPIVGISYNVFKGFYTGENDFLSLYRFYDRYQDVNSKWLGVNTGVGFEGFFRPGSFFAEYKMRIGFSDEQKQLNIMDVCFSAGLRLNLTVPTLYGMKRGTRSRYLLSRPSKD